MSGLSLVYAVFADEAEAERIGRAMVEARMAACVNLLGPIRSIYRWQDEVLEGREFAAIFKTPASMAAALVRAIAAMHSYDTPAVAAWPADQLPPGLAEWANEAAPNSTVS